MREAILIAVSLSCVHVAAAAVEVRTDHFRVVADIDAEVASRAAAFLELTRERYESLGFYRQTQREIVVLILPALADLDGFLSPGERRGGLTQGFSLRGSDRYYIVVAWDGPGDTYKPLAHELAHLTEREPESATWFREGLADYLAQLRSDAAGILRATPALGQLQLLHEQEWISWDRLVKADRSSQEYQSSLFYAQSWLAVDWLATKRQKLSGLAPDLLEKTLEALGPQAVTALVQAHAQQLGLSRTDFKADTPAEGPPASALPPWGWRYWQAELHRSLRHDEVAKGKLDRLATEFPGQPQIEASLAALAMDQAQYEKAEKHFENAVKNGGSGARVHHRFALTLLTPGPGTATSRAERAIEQARAASQLEPDNPKIRLTLAQALMVAKRWSASAHELRALALYPAWRARAEREFAELNRRRNRSTQSVEAPNLATGPPPQPPTFEPLPKRIPRPPAPPKPTPQKPRWPPPGSAIAAGRIVAVECGSSGKVIVLASGRYRLRFRETAGRPIQLFRAPIKEWKELPCGTRGWSVNVAYKPVRAGGAVHGEALAVLF